MDAGRPVEGGTLGELKDFLSGILPMTSVFIRVRQKLTAPPAKRAVERDLAEQLIEDHQGLQEGHGCERLVMVWCRLDRGLPQPSAVHASLAAFDAASTNDPDRPLADVRLRFP